MTDRQAESEVERLKRAKADLERRIKTTLREGERKIDLIRGGTAAEKLLAKQKLRREARRYVSKAALK